MVVNMDKEQHTRLRIPVASGSRLCQIVLRPTAPNRRLGWPTPAPVTNQPHHLGASAYKTSLARSARMPNISPSATSRTQRCPTAGSKSRPADRPPAGRVLHRLIGAETEYAIHFAAHIDVERVSDQELFAALSRQLMAMVQTREGRGTLARVQQKRFLENGGAIYYESADPSQKTGLIEASTPECRGPGQLLLYQRAQERLLLDALSCLSELPGTLSLRKNCRDAAGNIYGVQESYSVPVATGWRLLLLRLGLVGVIAVMLPFALLCRVLIIMMMAGLVCALVVLLPVELLRTMLAADRERAPFGWLEMLIQPLHRVEMGIRRACLTLPTLLFIMLMRRLAFRPHSTHAAAFLASRQVFSGAGTLLEDGRLALAEKACAVQRVFPVRMWGKQRYLFDPANLYKDLLSPSFGDSRRLLRLARPVWRLQVGMSDANMCQVAEYLKIGTTVLVFDAAESGVLDDAPQLARPAQAARDISIGGLHAEVELRDGQRTTALALQQWYHQRISTWLAEAETTSLEAHDVLRRWGDVLQRLEHDPDSLIGEVDWITKRSLLAEAGEDLSAAARKKIDLRYHELGTGYFAWLDEAGLAVNLLTESAILDAIRTAPDNTPATIRGRLIRESSPELRVDWDEASVGRRVIAFAEHARRHAQREP